jgi:hypothetical protein
MDTRDVTGRKHRSKPAFAPAFLRPSGAEKGKLT